MDNVIIVLQLIMLLLVIVIYVIINIPHVYYVNRAQVVLTVSIQHLQIMANVILVL